MSWFSTCSWCGGSFNDGNCRHCTNVSFREEPVYDSNPNSYNQTLDFSKLPPHHNYEIHSRSDTGASFQAEFAKFQQDFERLMAQLSCLNCGGLYNGGNCPSCSIVGVRNKSVHNPNPFPYDNTPNFYDQPPQHHVETYSFELCGNNSHYAYDCPPRECEIKINELKENFNGINIKINKKKELQQREQAANLSTYTTEPWRHFNFIFDDDDDYKESTISLNVIISQDPLSIAITHVLPIEDPENSLIMGDKDLHIIPEKESNKFINSSVEDLVLILSESEYTSNSECDLPFCGNSMTFSNPLFDSNDHLPLVMTSHYLMSTDIENKDSYVSNRDEPNLLVTPLFDDNEDEYFDPGDDVDEIELLLHRYPSTPKMSVASILEGFTNEPPLKENDDLFDLESK
uniref:Pre-mRNA splicing Prp18-interacting factor n=1 Tax=Tanacetum cinerariifolium TaxID=118510 RepID=A0A6L2L0G9_TANCI|nr:hypothetical protein [Tanacetum cinerariifolium]